VCLCQAQFPGQARVLDAGPAGGARPAVVARYEDVVRATLCHSSGNDAHTHL
jgi:hypothetical protein